MYIRQDSSSRAGKNHANSWHGHVNVSSSCQIWFLYSASWRTSSSLATGASSISSQRSQLAINVNTIEVYMRIVFFRKGPTLNRSLTSYYDYTHSLFDLLFQSFLSSIFHCMLIFKRHTFLRPNPIHNSYSLWSWIIFTSTILPHDGKQSFETINFW